MLRTDEIVKENGLRVELAETELLLALRQIAYQSNTKELKLPIVRKSLKKGTVVGHYLPSVDMFTFIGLLPRNYSLQFFLKPGTRTHLNLLRVISHELLQKDLNDVTNRILISLNKVINQDNETKIHPQPENLITDVEIFPGDFEIVESNGSPLAYLESLQHQIRSNFKQKVLSEVTNIDEKYFRVYDRSELNSTTVSGKFNLELEELCLRHSEFAELDRLANLEQPNRWFGFGNSASMIQAPQAEVRQDNVIVSATVKLDPKLLSNTSFVFHWGSYDADTISWTDTEIGLEEIQPAGNNTFVLTKKIFPQKQGNYGVTLCALQHGSKERHWFGKLFSDDGKFTLKKGYQEQLSSYSTVQVYQHLAAQKMIIENLDSFEKFSRLVNEFSKNYNLRGMGKLLFDLTKSDPILRKLISSYYEKALIESSQSKTPSTKHSRKKVLTALQNLGLGEIVFIAPEGQHAIAGGLAQVINGLSRSLNERNISSTIITPIYEEAQGRKHCSADELLQNGVKINGHISPINQVGSIEIDFGPTYYSGTKLVKQFPCRVSVTVYLAQHENVRIFFLRHPRLASRLYPGLPADEQIKRAIFLSKGALELIRTTSFGIEPHVIITNDWLTGPVHLYLKADPRYKNCENLSQVQTVHVLHNCGRAYQGRFYTNQFGEDLWPLFNLSDEHFFGLADPGDKNYLNLTAGAIFHVEKALLTVSRPYAQQLMTEEGGEGLHELFCKKSQLVFGISNGVDLNALRRVFWQLGENARAMLDLAPLASNKFSEQRLIKRLPVYKQSTKLVVQKKNSLIEDPDAILISFLGRLTEQKGTSLLTDRIAGENVSLLETLLDRYPTAQIIIGGPPSEGDPAFEKLLQTINALTKKFPGRIQGILDFIPHAEVLEITLGSDLFLMPSRYEPGGISQLEALATGTLVVAHNIGGISATLRDYRDSREGGNAFLFNKFTTHAFFNALSRGIKVIQDQKRKNELLLHAATSQNDWGNRAPQYLAMLQYVCGVVGRDNLYSYLAQGNDLLHSIRPNINIGTLEQEL